jgi:hypothetical protein
VGRAGRMNHEWTRINTNRRRLRAGGSGKAKVSGCEERGVDSQIRPARRDALHGGGRSETLLIFINVVGA